MYQGLYINMFIDVPQKNTVEKHLLSLLLLQLFSSDIVTFAFLLACQVIIAF